MQVLDKMRRRVFEIEPIANDPERPKILRSKTRRIRTENIPAIFGDTTDWEICLLVNARFAPTKPVYI